MKRRSKHETSLESMAKRRLGLLAMTVSGTRRWRSKLESDLGGWWLVAELQASWSSMERSVIADLGGVAPIVTSAAACGLSNSLFLDSTDWGSCGGIWVLCFWADMAWFLVICKDLVRHAWSDDDHGLYCCLGCRVAQSGWMFPVWLERS